MNKFTKKEFENALNIESGFVNNATSLNWKVKKRPFWTYFRNSNRETFNDIYKELQDEKSPNHNALKKEYKEILKIINNLQINK